MTEHSYICSSCGKEHAGLPTDWGFKLPDVVFSLSYLDKYRRSRSNADLCTLDESRYFLRGLLPVPLSGQDDEFSWGIWVEIDKPIHDLYLSHYNDDLSGEHPALGFIANAIPAFSGLGSEPVEIRFSDAKSRPSFYLLPSSAHPLAAEQRSGISPHRHHQYLEACGHFEPDA